MPCRLPGSAEAPSPYGPTSSRDSRRASGRADWKPTLHDGPFRERTSDRERSPQGVEAIAHILEAGAADDPRGIETLAVVLDAEREHGVLGPDAKSDVAGLRILGHVLKRLQATEVDS